MNKIKMTLAIFFLLQIKITPSARNLNKHVQDQINRGDTISTPTRRIYEIYSRVTGKFIQIIGSRVNANGISGSKYAKMEISSISFGGLITIRGVATGRYICLNKKGRLVGKRRRVNDRCKFTEKIAENYFDLFTNVRHPKWYLGFHASGNPKRGSKTLRSQSEVMFLKRPVMESSPMSTAAPSSLNAQAWKDYEKRFRVQFVHERKGRLNRQQMAATRNSMMNDEPSTLSIRRSKKHLKTTPSMPPDIQKVINIRRLMAKKIDKYELVLPRHPVSVSALATQWPIDKNTNYNKKMKINRKKNARRKRVYKGLSSRRRRKNLVNIDFDIESGRSNRKQPRKKKNYAHMVNT